MHKTIRAMILGGAMLSAVAPAMAQAGCNDGANRRIRMINQSGFTIRQMYGSNENTRSWQEDVLGDQVLGNNEALTVNWDDGTCACMYDFKVVYSDGTSGTKYGVNVCTVSQFTFN